MISFRSLMKLVMVLAAFALWRYGEATKVPGPFRPIPPVIEYPEQKILLGIPIEINHAAPAELEAIPDIGPKLAQKIVAYRESHGPFRSGASLEEVPGIGPKLRAKLEKHVSFGPSSRAQ